MQSLRKIHWKIAEKNSGQTRTDGRTDRVIPVYPPSTSWRGVYKNKCHWCYNCQKVQTLTRRCVGDAAADLGLQICICPKVPFRVTLAIYCFQIVQKVRKMCSADAHMWQKVQALIRCRLERAASNQSLDILSLNKARFSWMTSNIDSCQINQFYLWDWYISILVKFQSC